jgi:hypothetical protein
MRSFQRKPKAFRPNRLFEERDPLREQALAIEAERLGKSKGRRVLRRRFMDGKQRQSPIGKRRSKNPNGLFDLIGEFRSHILT